MKAKAKTTIDELASKIEDFGGLSDAIYENDDLYKDLTRIDIDFENVEYVDEYELPGTEDMEAFDLMKEGDASFPVAWCAGGGDWQMPVVFCIYIGENGNLRGFIPYEGNAYDKANNAPFSASEMDHDDNNYVFDSEKMRKDVKDNIAV